MARYERKTQESLEGLACSEQDAIYCAELDEWYELNINSGAAINPPEILEAKKFPPNGRFTRVSDAGSASAHAHANKTLLDTYTQTEVDIADAISKEHAHTNKALLDTYAQTEANLLDAVSKKHTQNTDAKLDEGGANELTAAETRTHLDNTTNHFTEGSIDHANIANRGTTSHTDIDTHIADLTKHRVINDAGTSATETWSASKINTELNNIAAGIGTRLHTAVQDITALKAIDTTTAADYPDKSLISVEDKGLYRLDRDSSDAGDDDRIVQPTAGVGRWFKMSASINDHNNLSNMQGGTTGERNHITNTELADVQAIDQIYTAAEKSKVGFLTVTQAVDLDTIETDTGLNNTHRASDGSDHTYINQDVSSGVAPTFNGANISGIVTGDVDQVHIVCRKGTAGTILQGRPVYVTGYNVGAAAFEVEEADNSNAAKMPALGIAETNITNSANTFVAIGGRLTGVDTTAYGVTDELYVGAGTALTATKPTGTALVQKVAQVLRSNAAGVLAVFGAGRENDVPNFNQYSEKVTPISADLILIEDSAASGAKKRVQIGNLPGGGGGDTVAHKNIIYVDSAATPVAGYIVADEAAAMTYINASGSPSMDNRWLVLVNNPITTVDYTIPDFVEVLTLKQTIVYSKVTVDTGTFTTTTDEISSFPTINGFVFSGVTTTGDTDGTAVVINIPDTSRFTAGDQVDGVDIATGTTVQSVDSGTQITLSQVATGTTVGGLLKVGTGKLIITTAGPDDGDIVVRNCFFHGDSGGIDISTTGVLIFQHCLLTGAGTTEELGKIIISAAVPALLEFWRSDFYDLYMEVTHSSAITVNFHFCNLVSFQTGAMMYSNHATAKHIFDFDKCIIEGLTAKSGAGTADFIYRGTEHTSILAIDVTSSAIAFFLKNSYIEAITLSSTITMDMKNSYVELVTDAGNNITFTYNQQTVSVFNKAAAPAVTDDEDNSSSNGYFSPGSFWTDTTNDKTWVCVDASNGAAIWKDITI